MPIERRKQAMTLLAGASVGAALMYFLDSQRGKARLAQTRDQAGGAVRDAKWELEIRRRALQNRAESVLAEIR